MSSVLSLLLVVLKIILNFGIVCQYSDAIS